ncbi:hypothetical protein LTR56_018611 [Elasticomyces elasticus]|nr:hypothetical protein LTR56_018611 [Elasticomyces elasticus]KAK3647361.1 hypothetical protein LTR22_013792 [Elasticomyces elasticus]KAK4917641.1 hypothetical protein LTR49_014463 [Elasticomyces elasticus]KAK5752028.1 hypothetical protein LTS12_017878 [Elasticomyces elasticus]
MPASKREPESLTRGMNEGLRCFSLTAMSNIGLKRRAKQQRGNECKEVVFMSKPRHMPSNAAERLGNELVHAINKFNMSTMAPAFITPRQLGNSILLDSAANVLVQLSRHTCTVTNTITTQAPILRSYGVVLKYAGVFVSSTDLRSKDETVTALTLLFLIDSLMKSYDPTWTGGAAHLQGALALFCSRTSARHPPLAVRAALCCSDYYAFILPVYTEQISPFEHEAWLDMDIPSLEEEPRALSRLRRISHKLNILLPRLIRDVRALREGCRDERIWVAARVLADKLMALEDKDSESRVLHEVQLIPTLDANDRLIVPYSFKFNTIQPLVDALDYWKVRLVLNGLQSALASLESSWAVGSPMLVDIGSTQSHLDAEGHRLATNILMSWQDDRSRPPSGTLAMSHAVTVVRCYMQRLTKYRGVPRAVMEDWLYEAFKRSWLRGYCASKEEWDTWRVLDGGQLSTMMMKAGVGKGSR